MQSTNKKPLIVLVIGLVLLGFVVFIIVSLSSKSDKDPRSEIKTTEYYDADSGQTVIEEEGRGPETVDSEEGKPVFLGFHELTDQGNLTQDQLAILHQTLEKYAAEKKIKEISLKVSTIKNIPTNPDEIRSITEFDIKFDRKPVYYKVNVESTGLSTSQVRMYNSGGSLVLDSGVLDSSAIGHD